MKDRSFRALIFEGSIAATSLLRLATISVKSLLIIALAVWLSPADLGTYGLIVASVTLTTYFYGLDFYTFTIRQLSIRQLDDVRYRLRDTFALFGAAYVVGSAVLLLALPLLGVTSVLLPVVVVLCAAQHGSLEFYRVLLRLEHTATASVCLLIRDAAWVPFCLASHWLRQDLTVLQVLLFWLGGSIASLGFGAVYLARILPAGEPRPVDLAWLTRGIRTGLRMLVGTVALRAFFTVDRMIMAAFAPPDVLGAYVFFTMACASISGLFETAILPYFWPRLLEASKQGDREAQDRAQRRLRQVCLFGAGVGAVVMIIGGAVIANLLPEPAYAQNLDLLLYVAVAYLFLTLSNIPHYRLYVENRDLMIVIGNLASFLGFLAASFLLNGLGSSVAVPLALVIGCVFLFVSKSWAVARFA